MRILFGAIGCVVLSLITSYIFPNFNLGIGAISTLYTVSGIMFSIGMSLIVTFNVTGVKDKTFKKLLRDGLHLIQNHFIIIFIAISLFYILLSPCLNPNTNNMLHICKIFNISYSQFLTYSIAYSIIYFVTNFLKIERLNCDLRDHIDKEEEDS